jgi:hypothetical protein
LEIVNILNGLYLWAFGVINTKLSRTSNFKIKMFNYGSKEGGQGRGVEDNSRREEFQP